MGESKVMDWPEPADDGDRHLLSDVKSHGWHVIAIEEDEEGPSFAYSVGLYHTFEHAEIIVFGLAVNLMHQMINQIGEQIRAGHRFSRFEENGDVLQGANIFFQEVERAHFPEYFGYANWFYRRAPFPALQCVWPDAQHRFPWDPKFDSKLATRQPVLYSADGWPFAEGRNRAVFSCRSIVRDHHPILRVVHDNEGDWQFLDGELFSPANGMVVVLGRVVDGDPSIAQLAGMPRGFCAERATLASEWKYEKLSTDE